MKAFKSFFKPVDPEIQYDPVELGLGIEEELEHTPYRSIATMIAKQHLAKDSNYYSKLSQQHKDTKQPINK
jgi:hypothetical protein